MYQHTAGDNSRPGIYTDIVVVNVTHTVGTSVRIIDDNYYSTGNGGFNGKSGTVAICYRESNHRSQYVTIYMLLDNFKAYKSLVVVEGTLKSISYTGKKNNK
jgi:hypothetical protein